MTHIHKFIKACRKYSRENEHDFTENCHGDTGWRLQNGGFLGCGCINYCICCDRAFESGSSKAFQAHSEVVADGTFCTDQKKTGTVLPGCCI